MALGTIGGRHNLPEVVLGDEREELETESGFDSVRFLCFVVRVLRVLRHCSIYPLPKTKK